MFYRVLVLLSCWLLAACGANYQTEKLAKQGDWFAIGLSDGEKGLPSRNIGDLTRLADLAKDNNFVDFAAYDEGYNQGIARFCVVGNAYSIGLAGMPYHGVCSNLPEGLQFNLEWQRGYQAFQNSL